MSASASLADRALGALRNRFGSALARRVIWLTDARRDLSGVPTSGFALVVVLGREHYTERRKRYPVAGWRDLRRVLAQELGPETTTLAVIGPLVELQREVAFYEIRAAAAEQFGRALWVLPESLVLARALSAGTVAVIERDGFRYGLEPAGQSHPFAGPIANPALFRLAVGLDEGSHLVNWSAAEARAALPGALRKVPASAWIAGLRTAALRTSAIAWRPLATLAGVALVGYLALASIYLAGAQALREKALGTLGAEVESLLQTQHRVARMGEAQAAIATVLGARRPTIELWKVVAAAWSHGAALAQVRYADGELTLRGHAPSATDVLGALTALPGVRDAKFAAPVRHEAVAREEFAITLTLIPEPAHG